MSGRLLHPEAFHCILHPVRGLILPHVIVWFVKYPMYESAPNSGQRLLGRKTFFVLANADPSTPILVFRYFYSFRDLI